MERSRGSTLIFSGSMIGTVFTIPVAGQLSKTTFLGGWPSTFYLLGGLGIVWFILWALLISESPESHPYISQQEHDFILQNGGGAAKKDVNIINRGRLNLTDNIFQDYSYSLQEDYYLGASLGTNSLSFWSELGFSYNLDFNA